MATKVLPLTVGPILGYTTGASARLWGRASLELVAGRPRPCTGVARIRPAGGRRYSAPIFFPMNPNFDMTGVMQFGELTAETAYEYQIGFIFGDFARISCDTCITTRPSSSSTEAWSFGNACQVFRGHVPHSITSARSDSPAMWPTVFPSVVTTVVVW